MEVHDQLHTQVALPPGKEPPVHTGQEAGWAPELAWTRQQKEENTFLPLLGIEHRSSSPQQNCLTDWATSTQLTMGIVCPYTTHIALTISRERNFANRTVRIANQVRVVNCRITLQYAVMFTVVYDIRLTVGWDLEDLWKHELWSSESEEVKGLHLGWCWPRHSTQNLNKGSLDAVYK
jgi:hypothetical protein